MTPRKPDRPLRGIVFPKKKPGGFLTEQLPRTQGELELAIAQKFAASLALYHKRRVTIRSDSAPEPADVLADSDNGPVCIQIVEVVDPVRVQLRRQRSSYKEALEKTLSSWERGRFDGCNLEITDTGAAPFLPEIRKLDGQRALAELQSQLARIGDELHTLEGGKYRTRSFDIKGVKLAACIERRFAGVRTLFWAGGKRTVVGEGELLLMGTVKKKIAKTYAKPRRPFWLLAYSTDHIVDVADVQSARGVLTKVKHPFSEVWFIYPFPHKQLGHLVELFP